MSRNKIFILGALMSLMALTGCEGDNIGDIEAIYVSPTGEYQAEVVNISYGATGGENDIFVERADKTAFPSVEEQNTKDSIKIEEVRRNWGASRDIEWISDDTFVVITGDADYNKVTMNGDSYTVMEDLEIDELKTKVLDTSISGNTIEITAQIHVKNNTDRTVSFVATTYITTDIKSMWMMGQADARAETDLDTGEPLKLGPGESKSFKVKLVGTKKSDESFSPINFLNVYVSATKME